jgi:hypothetical protein
MSSVLRPWLLSAIESQIRERLESKSVAIKENPRGDHVDIRIASNSAGKVVQIIKVAYYA